MTTTIDGFSMHTFHGIDQVGQTEQFSIMKNSTILSIKMNKFKMSQMQIAINLKIDVIRKLLRNIIWVYNRNG